MIITLIHSITIIYNHIMHLYSIIETVLYVFYEAILNKSVYSLLSMCMLIIFEQNSKYSSFASHISYSLIILMSVAPKIFCVRKCKYCNYFN